MSNSSRGGYAMMASSTNQSCKRHRPSGNESPGDIEGPAVKRRSNTTVNNADRNFQSSSTESDGGISPAGGNKFSEFFDDEMFTLESSTQSNSTFNGQADASIDDLFDEAFSTDLVNLSDGKFAATNPSTAQGVQEPPSSVIRGLDRGSRSAEEFDPRLQHSPAKSSDTVEQDVSREPPELKPEQEPSWIRIENHIQQRDRQPRPVGPAQGLSVSTSHRSNAIPSASVAAVLPRKAGTREIDRTSIGYSPDKTFFHIGEMIEAKTHKYKDQPQVEFDWFARVLYSVRENFHQKQYFQFRDLFKEAPPYLSGTLLG